MNGGSYAEWASHTTQLLTGIRESQIGIIGERKKSKNKQPHTDAPKSKWITGPRPHTETGSLEGEKREIVSSPRHHTNIHVDSLPPGDRSGCWIMRRGSLILQYAERQLILRHLISERKAERAHKNAQKSKQITAPRPCTATR